MRFEAIQNFHLTLAAWFYRKCLNWTFTPLEVHQSTVARNLVLARYFNSEKEGRFE